MFRPNWPILLMSIVLSTFLWFVRFGQELQTDGTIPVDLPITNVVGLPVNFSLKGDIPRFKLEISGPAEEVGKVESENPNNLITVDLSSARPGNFSYPLLFNPSIAKLVKGPKAVNVQIEEIVHKQVSVQVSLKGKLSDPSSRLEDYPVSDGTATVIAPRSIADQITHARAVLDLNEINPANPRPQEALLVAIGDKQITFQAQIEPVRVTITPIVMAAQVRKSVLISPDIVGTPATGYIPVGATLSPKQVVLSGPTSTLINVFSVKTQPIDITNLTQSKKFSVRLLLPAGTTCPTKSVNVRYDVTEDPAVRKAKTAKPVAANPVNSTGLQP
jgi:YbbR domain-containing protein